MNKNIEYLEYFKFYYYNLNVKKKSRIKELLKENMICPVRHQENGMLVDNSSLSDDQFIFSCIVENTKAILTLQENEYTQEYKYSNYFLYEGEINFNTFNEFENIQKINEIEHLNNLNKIEKCSYYTIEGKHYFKFTFKEDTVSKFSIEILKTKLSFVVLVDPINKVIEIRYDHLSSPFKSKQNYYIEFIEKIMEFFYFNLNIKLTNFDMEFLHANLGEIRKKWYNVLSKEAQYDDHGGATMISNEDDQLPYIDEVMEIFDSKESNYKNNPVEYTVFNELRDALKNFIKEKEDEARHKWIIMDINEYRTKFTFNHKNDICVIHHNNIKYGQAGRLDYVKGKILELKRQFDK